MTRFLTLFLLFSFSAAAQNVVATFEGKPITEAEIIAPVESKLREIREAEYDLKREAAEAHVVVLIRERIAKEEGITQEQLWSREVEAKIVAPTDAEIAAMVQQYRSRLPADEAQARKVVADALRQNRLQERERAWRSELLSEADFRLLLEPVRYPIVPLESDAVVTGPASAPVTIVEFSDFQCPYCGQAQELVGQIAEKYGERVRVVFKQLPLEIHPQARLAAEASLCARDQGKFEELHDWLFANARSITVESMKAAAPELGIDSAKLESCLVEKKHAASVDEQLAQAVAVGVNSTPSFFVNGRKVTERSLAGVSRMIDEELGERRSQKAEGRSQK
ncbi:MAG: DsbA family protein [Thermoanaerobaculia bacterium]